MRFKRRPSLKWHLWHNCHKKTLTAVYRMRYTAVQGLLMRFMLKMPFYEAGSIKMQKSPKRHKLHILHKLHKPHKLFIFQRYTIRMSSSSVVLTSFITWSWQAWSTLKRWGRQRHCLSQSDGELHVHKRYKGLLPICYYDTGLRGYGPQDGYTCFDGRDMLWARRLRFHIDHLRFLYC